MSKLTKLQVALLNKTTNGVEVSESIFDDTVGKLEQVEERVATGIRRLLGISPRISLVEPRTLDQVIPPKAGHIVIDKREL